MVFDDVDIAAAAEGIAGAGYFNAGQDCTAAARVLVSERIADDLTAALADAARATRVGGPDDPDAYFGPVNNSFSSPACRASWTGRPSTPRSSPAATGSASGGT